MWLRSRRIPAPESPPDDSQHERNPNPERRPPRENPYQLPGGLTARPQFVLQKWQGTRNFVIHHPDLDVIKNSFRTKRVEARPPAAEEALPNGRKNKCVRSHQHFAATLYAKGSLLGNLALKTDSQLAWTNDNYSVIQKLGDHGVVVSFPGYRLKTDVPPESLVVEDGQVITEHGLLVAYVVIEGSLGCFFLRPPAIADTGNAYSSRAFGDGEGSQAEQNNNLTESIFYPTQSQSLGNVSLPSKISSPERKSTPNPSPLTPRQIPTPDAQTPTDNHERDVEANGSENAEPLSDMNADSQARAVNSVKRRLFVEDDTSGNEFKRRREQELHLNDNDPMTPLTESDPSTSESASQICDYSGWKILHKEEPELARYFAKARLRRIVEIIHPLYLWEPATPPKGKQYRLRSLQVCADARNQSLLNLREFINLPHQRKRNLKSEGKQLEIICYPDGKRSSGERCSFKDVIRKGKEREDSLYLLGY